MENTTCAVFEEYEEVPEMALLEFFEDDVTWFESNISGALGALGAEAIKLRNCLLRFGCMPEELSIQSARLVTTDLNSSGMHPKRRNSSGKPPGCVGTTPTHPTAVSSPSLSK